MLFFNKKNNIEKIKYYKSILSLFNKKHSKNNIEKIKRIEINYKKNIKRFINTNINSLTDYIYYDFKENLIDNWYYSKLIINYFKKFNILQFLVNIFALSYIIYLFYDKIKNGNNGTILSAIVLLVTSSITGSFIFIKIYISSQLNIKEKEMIKEFEYKFDKIDKRFDKQDEKIDKNIQELKELIINLSKDKSYNKTTEKNISYNDKNYKDDYMPL